MCALAPAKGKGKPVALRTGAAYSGSAAENRKANKVVMCGKWGTMRQVRA